ncbi:MAG TPA: hypothetical protein VNU49_05245 [Opitutaceae bacterium]|jgi:hypothetical protein|nr:hypothetical protein [Opitutaceae bacterium]
MHHRHNRDNFWCYDIKNTAGKSMDQYAPVFLIEKWPGQWMPRNMNNRQIDASQKIGPQIRRPFLIPSESVE